MTSRDIERLRTLFKYLCTHAEVTYIRDTIDGRIGSYALTDFPVKRALWHSFRMVLESLEATRGSTEGA